MAEAVSLARFQNDASAKGEPGRQALLARRSGESRERRWRGDTQEQHLRGSVSPQYSPSCSRQSGRVPAAAGHTQGAARIPPALPAAARRPAAPPRQSALLDDQRDPGRRRRERHHGVQQAAVEVDGAPRTRAYAGEDRRGLLLATADGRRGDLCTRRAAATRSATSREAAHNSMGHAWVSAGANSGGSGCVWGPELPQERREAGPNFAPRRGIA